MPKSYYEYSRQALSKPWIKRDMYLEDWLLEKLSYIRDDIDSEDYNLAGEILDLVISELEQLKVEINY